MNVVLDSGTPEQIALADAMSALSQWYFCATWYDGTEYALWHMLITGVCDWQHLTAAQVAPLTPLYVACGGWVAWDDTLGDLRFYPLAEWLAHIAARQEI